MPSFSGIAAQETGPRSTQVERIAIVPFVNTTGVEQWDNLATSMGETIALTLRLGDRYDIATPDPEDIAAVDPYAPTGPGDLRTLAEQYRLDAAVIGRISNLDSDRLELETSVWSSVTGSIIGSERREAFGAFDIIEASDELVVMATSAILGYRVEFGAAIFKPTRTDIDYSLYIDGIPVGNRVSSIPQILTGRRRIDIMVEVGDRETPVYSADRLIRSGEAIEIRFGLPQVTRREERAIQVHHELARNLLGQPHRYQDAFDALSESQSLLASAPDSASLGTLRKEQATLQTIWRLDEEFAGLDPAALLEREEGGRYGSGLLPNTYRIAAETRFAGEPAVRRRIERNGAAQFYLLRLAWLQALEEGEWESADHLLSRMETIVDSLSLTTLEETRSVDGTAYTEARGEAEAIARRTRRPWPYMGLVAGLGGVGYGGYTLYEQRGDLSLEEGIDPRIWASAAGGSALSLISGAIVARNQRADENFMRDWVRSEYSGDINRGAAAIDALVGDPPEDEARIVVLGPPDVIASVNGNPRTLPVIIEQEAGLPIDIGRPTRVGVDGTRLYGHGTWFMVVD